MQQFAAANHVAAQLVAMPNAFFTLTGAAKRIKRLLTLADKR